MITSKVSSPKQLEDQAAEAQTMEAIGRSAGGIAHDFNNLLLVIAGYSDLLLTDPATSELSAVKEIAKAAEYGTVLTRQLLAGSRQEVLALQPLDLNDVVLEVVAMLRRLIIADIEIAVRLAPDVRSVQADPGALERMLVNLAINARDAMPTGGTLGIETVNVDLDESHVTTHLNGLKGPNVMLAVSDTGTGMSEDVCSRLFQPFFTTKGSGLGTGLGLASVCTVVKQAGGSINVASEEGEGTTFTIFLPSGV